MCCKISHSTLSRDGLVKIACLLTCLALGWLANQAPAAEPTAALAPAATANQPPLSVDEALLLAPRVTTQTLTTEPVIIAPSVERKRLTKLREALSPVKAPVPQLRMQALEPGGVLDYDSEDQIIYSPGRTRVRYGQFALEADKVILDNRLQEVQAEGNVSFQMGKDKITADSIRYNFKEDEGVAFNASGTHTPVFFRPASAKGEKKGREIPQFQKVSKQEAIFRDTQITTCDFKIPHFSVKGREVILYFNDRVFMRGATFYVWGIPSLYLPFYSRSLTEGSPWFTQLGYNSRAGGYIRFGYSYTHRTEEPSFENEDEFVTRSGGHAEVFTDYLSKRGPGAGFSYDYSLDYGRHKGNLEVYGLYDSERKVVGPNINDQTPFHEYDRWRLLWQNRTAITDKLSLINNIDEFSDPDIFYDVLDLFNDKQNERERQIIRRSRVALTDVEEAFVVRLMADVKDRIGRNWYKDPSNPNDNDRDFDLDPFTTIKNSKSDGLSAKRWGRVSEKLPQFDVATRYLPVGNRPLYYMTELHLYNSLDEGLNVVSTNDDAFVQGAEFYQQFMHQWKLSERYTLVGKVGAGVGEAARDNDSLGVNFHGNAFPQQIDALTFVNSDQTFLIGKKEKNLDQIEPLYGWADTEWRLNARFSDALTGNVLWRYRETTSNFIGDWYAHVGSTTVREDLFNYKLRQNWVEGNLNYMLARPLMTFYTGAGYNLVSQDDLFPNEPIARWGGGVRWATQDQTLAADTGVYWSRRQIFDPSDVDSFQEDVVGSNVNVTYSPIHQRWYSTLRVNYSHSVNGSVARSDNDQFTFFSDEDARNDVRWIYGRELGPKYNTEFTVRWEKQAGGLREISWLLQRDLHDAVAILKLGVENNELNATSATDQGTQFTSRVGVKFKLPNKEVAFTNGNSKTLRQRTRQPAVAY